MDTALASVYTQPTHILDVENFDPQLFEQLFERADELRELYATRAGRLKLKKILAGVNIAKFFYEPSTRTSFSFGFAALALGANVKSSDNAAKFSSRAKGETIEDTVRNFPYLDAIVIRSDEKGSLARAAQFTHVPLINAGDGSGEHPTQTLLDLYTIWRLRDGNIDGAQITMVGDLKRGRTVHSLARAARMYPNVKLTFVAPKGSEMPQNILEELRESGNDLYETKDFSAVLPHTEFLYMTRVQKERFTGVLAKWKYEQARKAYKIDASNIALLPQTSWILHPLPRVGEIDPALDTDPRAHFFKQAENGFFIRMALLEHVIKGRP